MAGEVSRKNLEDVVSVLSETVSRFYPGKPLHVEERYYRAWRQSELFICELCSGEAVLCRSLASAGSESQTRKCMLEQLSSSYGWPLSFSGEEMRLKLSLLPEKELRDKCRRFFNPARDMLKTAAAEV